MDYEKKYKEALERAKVIYQGSYKPDTAATIAETLQNVFPELCESEDEKIRKGLIKLVKATQSDELWCEYCVSKADALAWLEKQEGCEYIKKDWLEHIKQSWYKEGFIDGKYSGGASKEWSINDAATLKELIDFLENGTAKLQHDLTHYANWLKIKFTPKKHLE